MLKIGLLLGAILAMSEPGFARSFQENCRDALARDHEHVSRIYYEFMDGGDVMYGGKAPIGQEAWDKLKDAEKCALVERTLNRPQFVLKYPGTFSGPATKDLLLLRGLDAIESFECDCMMVTSYTALLDLPNLKSVSVDVFNHTQGYEDGVWSVFDALIHAKKISDFKSVLKEVDRYRTELDLSRSFGTYPELQGPHTSGEPGSELGFITEEFLYEHFSL